MTSSLQEVRITYLTSFMSCLVIMLHIWFTKYIADSSGQYVQLLPL